MDVVFRIVNTIVFSIIATIVLFSIENRSNLPSFIVIPFLVAVLAKYILGDWDSGFRWTILDVLYWFSIIGSSYGILYMISTK